MGKQGQAANEQDRLVRGRFFAPAMMQRTTAAGLDGEGAIGIVGEHLVIEGRRVRMGVSQFFAALGFFAGFALSVYLGVVLELVDFGAQELPWWGYPIFALCFPGLWLGSRLGRTIAGSEPVSLRVPGGGASAFQLGDDGDLAFRIHHAGLRGVVFFVPAPGERERFEALCERLQVVRPSHSLLGAAAAVVRGVAGTSD